MTSHLTLDDTPKPGWTPPISWFVSRVCWREIGRRLLERPELIEETKKYLEGVRVSGEFHCSPHYIDQWLEITNQGLQPVVDVLMSPDDEHSQVLRSCTPRPIRLLMSPEEREQIRLEVTQEVESRGWRP